MQLTIFHPQKILQVLFIVSPGENVAAIHQLRANTDSHSLTVCLERRGNSLSCR
jgi:hypothetical protein